MQSDFYQKLALYFRDKYISALEPFVIQLDQIDIKPEIYKTLPPGLKAQLDIEKANYTHFADELNQDKQHFDAEAEKIDDGLLAKELRASARVEASIISKIINYRKAYKLYIVGFDKSLTCRTAHIELRRIGFQPASLLETILFCQNYQGRLNKYLPIISLEAYHDMDKKLQIMSNNKYALWLTSQDIQFASMGNIEASEGMMGATFIRHTSFLAKPI